MTLGFLGVNGGDGKVYRDGNEGSATSEGKDVDPSLLLLLLLRHGRKGSRIENPESRFERVWGSKGGEGEL